MPARVSVIIPSHNSSATIERAIDSVAAQTYPYVKVYLVDDASQDDTVTLVEAALSKVAQTREHFDYEIVALSVNGGPAAARNAGVRKADDEYVAFLDSDDVWLPEKLERQVALLDANPNVRLCGCQADWVDEEGRFQSKLYEGLPDMMTDGWKVLLWNCFIATPCAVVRRCDLGTEPFDTSLPIGEDRDLWIRLASNGDVALVPEVMVEITVSSFSYMSRNSSLITSVTRPMLEKHMRDFSDSISGLEMLRARGKLCSDIGKVMCSDPAQYWDGFPYMVQAILFHSRRFDCLRYLVLNAPGFNKTKNHLKKAYIHLTK